MPYLPVRRAATALAAAATLASPALAQLDTRLVADGLSQPVYATAPLADGRVFIVEKGGTIRLSQGGAVSTFLSIPVATSGEQGLLGLAFDPHYGVAGTAGHRRFFVNYIDPVNGDTVIASYLADASGNTAQAGSRREVMRIDQPNGLTNHKAGWIGFKPGDVNNLYIATGDGGSGNDPSNFAQNRGVLLGKVLRINVNGDDFADPNTNYAVPTDNPFVGQAGVRGEIFAYGLRNPWRNSFDRITGDLWIADVGQGQREEVDFIGASSPGGQNFGWRVREGDISTPGVGGPDSPAFTSPLWVYNRSFGSSITGGYVVREATSPLDGRYIFGDFVIGRIWTMPAAGPYDFGTERVDLTAILDAGAAGPLGNIASFGEGPGGELYIVDFGGKVVQVVPEPATVATLLAGAMLWAVALRRRAPAPAPSACQCQPAGVDAIGQRLLRGQRGCVEHRHARLHG
jgi:glucose/arabinose dehydrogenase